MESVVTAAGGILPQQGPLVPVIPHVVAAGVGVVANPVEGRGPAHQVEGLLGEIKEDDVADDVPVVAARNQMFGLVYRKPLEAVETDPGQELEGVGPFQDEVHHVIGKIEEDAGLLPRLLFVSPVAEFGRNSGVDIGSDLGVTQHLHDVRSGVEQLF